MKQFNKLLKLCLTFWLALLLSFSCEKNPADNGTDATPPKLPPAGSMVIDKSVFETNAGSLAKTFEAESKLNYTNAVIRVAFINTSVLV